MSLPSGPGQVEVSFRYARHLGPRFVHGAVTLRFDSLQPYSFVSRARWPTPENYEAAIRETVEAVLLERQGNLYTTCVVLEAIEWDPVLSCEAGFRSATRAACEAAFSL